MMIIGHENMNIIGYITFPWSDYTCSLRSWWISVFDASCIWTFELFAGAVQVLKIYAALPGTSNFRFYLGSPLGIIIWWLRAWCIHFYSWRIPWLSPWRKKAPVLVIHYIFFWWARAIFRFWLYTRGSI